jgi:probable HAF family extracellular repeat protein
MGMHSLLRRWPAAAAAVLIASTGLLAEAAPGPYVLSMLGDPPGDSTQSPEAYAINGNGVVAGQFRTSADLLASSPFVSLDGTMHNLGTPLGRVHAGARGINDLGQVVGLTNEFDLDGRAFLWQQGVGHVDLGTLGGQWAHAHAINNAGTVVGWSVTETWAGRAFLYRDGVMHDIHQLGVQTEARAISPNGTVAGNWSTANFEERAFIYRDGVMHDVDPLHEHEHAYANGVNDAGQVVGMGMVGDDYHAAMWQDGVMHDLGTLGGVRSEALAINTRGQIVGRSTTPGDKNWRAFIHDEGRMWALTPLIVQGGEGCKLQSARAINDRGQITGMAICDGERRPYLLTPIPAGR